MVYSTFIISVVFFNLVKDNQQNSQMQDEIFQHRKAPTKSQIITTQHIQNLTKRTGNA